MHSNSLDTARIWNLKKNLRMMHSNSLDTVKDLKSKEESTHENIKS